MKAKLQIIVTLFFLLTACQKDPVVRKAENKGNSGTSLDSLSLAAVRSWWRLQDSSDLTGDDRSTSMPHQFRIGTIRTDWSKAERIVNNKINYWLVPLDGQPSFQKVKQGYRKMAFTRDKLGHIQARILEIIPDGLTLQLRHKMSVADFTGRIFVFNSAYVLLGGQLIANGRPVGTIKPGNSVARNNNVRVKEASAKSHANSTIIQTCYWTDGYYVDGDNGPVIYSEQTCNYYINDDDPVGDYSGGVGSSGGSGSSGSGASAPAPSNLPNEDDPKINPERYMNCFGTIPDVGSKTTVTVYVVEPTPGTSFNIGPNSVGHTAIGLTKTNGKTTITQVVGFYPNATGLSKMNAPSMVLDNGGDLQYTVSITYDVLPSQFNSIVNFVSNPPATYDLLSFNCTNFVYTACQKGGITLPDPYTSVAFDAAQVMTPGALGSSIADLAGEPEVNAKGGTTSNSHGACN